MLIAVAAIGSRETPDSILSLMEKTGAWLARKGYIVKSGNATGADQAWARGVNSVDPTSLVLSLPWPSYETQAIRKGNMLVLTYPEWMREKAKQLHPAWDRLGQGGEKLMIRNIDIIHGVRQTLCWMNPVKQGGTGQGVRYSLELGIPVLNLYYPEVRAKIEEKISGT